MLPVPWQKRYADRPKAAREALKMIDCGTHILIGSDAASPQLRIEEMLRSAADLSISERDPWRKEGYDTGQYHLRAIPG